MFTVAATYALQFLWCEHRFCCFLELSLPARIFFALVVFIGIRITRVVGFAGLDQYLRFFFVYLYFWNVHAVLTEWNLRLSILVVIYSLLKDDAPTFAMLFARGKSGLLLSEK